MRIRSLVQTEEMLEKSRVDSRRRLLESWRFRGDPNAISMVFENYLLGESGVWANDRVVIDLIKRRCRACPVGMVVSTTIRNLNSHHSIVAAWGHIIYRSRTTSEESLGHWHVSLPGRRIPLALALVLNPVP